MVSTKPYYYSTIAVLPHPHCSRFCADGTGGLVKSRAFGKGVPDKAFHVEVPRGILLSSASKKGRTWEHGAGAPCKLLSSRSFSESKRSEKAFRKRRFISKFLRVFLFCFGGKEERPWEHKACTS